MVFAKWLIVTLTFFIITSFYIFSISKKYHHFTINTAGKLNTTWLLAPGLTDTQRLVIPPPYSNSVSNWDDPTYQQKLTVSPFTSTTYLTKEIKLTLYNSFSLLKILNSISFFAIPIILFFLIFLYRKKKERLDNNSLLLFTTLLYPAGYLLILIEWRYIWLLPILIIIMGGIVLSALVENKILSNLQFKILSSIYLLSFCYTPLLELIKLNGKGKYETEVAQVLKANNIVGNFFTKVDNNYSHQASLPVIMYLTQSQMWGGYKMEFTKDELQQAIKQYPIQYIIQLHEKDSDAKKLLESDAASLVVKVYDKLHPNVIVFKMK